jgi:mRNA interferase RelE/StbE
LLVLLAADGVTRQSQIALDMLLPRALSVAKTPSLSCNTYLVKGPKRGIPVRVQEEVLQYLRKLAPEPRHALSAAIKGLAYERGDIKPLTEELEGFYRLRVGSHRVIFEYEMIAGCRTVTCIFAGARRWIYEIFQSRLME